jgi:hypothetical protein
MTKAKLRKHIRRLERENLQLIIEANAARARAGEAQEALAQWPMGAWTYQTEDGEWRTLSHG